MAAVPRQMLNRGSETGRDFASGHSIFENSQNPFTFKLQIKIYLLLKIRTESLEMISGNPGTPPPPSPVRGAITSGRIRAKAKSGAHSITLGWDFFKFHTVNCSPFKAETSTTNGKANTTRACGHVVCL